MNKKIKKEYMRLALAKARENLVAQEGGPFGACIVEGSQVLALEKNKVLCEDATAHAEIKAIRAASQKKGNFDLSKTVIYSTSEPCPMCFAAIHWARIGFLVYGTKITAVAKLGFNELRISSQRLKTLGKCKLKIYPNFLTKECQDLLLAWDNLPQKKLY